MTTLFSEVNLILLELIRQKKTNKYLSQAEKTPVRFVKQTNQKDSLIVNNRFACIIAKVAS